MSQLGQVDSGFMTVEDVDRHVNLGIGAVAVMAGPAPTRADFVAEMSRRLSVNARFRQKVRTTVFDLAAPRWVDDPEFDLAHHIRWDALPDPCDEPTLCELIATIMEERLDRDHPLWQCTVIERLTDDRWAVLVKAHHSMVDGISGIALFEALCDQPTASASAGHTARAPKDDRAPKGWLDSAARGLRLPLDAPRFVFDTVRGLAPVALGAVLPGVESSLNGPIGRQRRYAIARTSLSAVRDVGAAFGVTVNDVALTLVTSAFRSVLQRRGEEPTADKLRILMPVSIRSEAAKGVLDNRVSVMLPYLPVDLDDLVDQLDAVHHRVSEHKKTGEVHATQVVLSIAKSLPFAPLSWTIRLASRYPQRAIGAVATNVPGPTRQLYLQGKEVQEILAYVPIAMRIRTGIAILSYGDQLMFGITGDYDSTADIDMIADGIEHAMAELLARTKISRSRRVEAAPYTDSGHGSRKPKSPTER
ncbi:wax ester/triacylglycerol synthase family O-acyltransferase [Nocardia sp. XZ_19_231]|uniref:wax ester/triacylglycerol synthase family O-acyltransferase n=1 Tax=Nocardia sp. XZ_19_231 TaxID=2769252 RepID=UPI00188EC452|nr:wax ester/triacylglycerol synthase family O-acyltransferase [Nocardia sp. XZ_19_231]